MTLAIIYLNNLTGVNMNLNSKIFLAGHRGLAGSAILRKLLEKGYDNIITRNSLELDLRNQFNVNEFFKNEDIDCVILAAAKVGGINANMNNLSGFLVDNLLIQTNVIKAAHDNNVKKLVFLGSSCIYPKDSKQPLKEDYLLTGLLEPTNEGYAIAKIAGLKLCEYYNNEYGKDFITVVPPNLYGMNDNFNPDSSHVIAGILNRMHNAKINNLPSVKIWGSGNQFREFMHVDDMADAVVFLLERYSNSEFINIGTGEDITIKDLANLIKKVIGFKGELIFDSSKPDGMYRKVLDVSKISKFGWKYQISLKQGLIETYNWFLEEFDSEKK
ncbi:GDP-L-fucose synthase [Methanobrevibacter cuticularis]|uniref:GDP-L-fucose synthase n=2 Tax=Methanobrevibacter cuticularis TaxID=47311 RepID=A0A166CMD2_9EURY|nr:GDP-L-fucose synthase [Methanobrevibacter cuticularis]